MKLNNYAAFVFLFFTALPDASGQTKSMTVLVHGTCERDHSWYQPAHDVLRTVLTDPLCAGGQWAVVQHFPYGQGSNPQPGVGLVRESVREGSFHKYLRESVFPDLYNEHDFFFWDGQGLDSSREAAADALIAWCDAHPTDQLRLIGHSHGCTVISKALRKGLKAFEIIYLSPLAVQDGQAFQGRPGPGDYPRMENVTIQRFLNIHPEKDGVVTCAADAQQNFQGTLAAEFEAEIVLHTGGDGGGLCLGCVGFCCYCPADPSDHQSSYGVSWWKNEVEPRLIDACQDTCVNPASAFCFRSIASAVEGTGTGCARSISITNGHYNEGLFRIDKHVRLQAVGGAVLIR